MPKAKLQTLTDFINLPSKEKEKVMRRVIHNANKMQEQVFMDAQKNMTSGAMKA
jgi:hypothetical protein